MRVLFFCKNSIWLYAILPVDEYSLDIELEDRWRKTEEVKELAFTSPFEPERWLLAKFRISRKFNMTIRNAARVKEFEIISMI